MLWYFSLVGKTKTKCGDDTSDGPVARLALFDDEDQVFDMDAANCGMFIVRKNTPHMVVSPQPLVGQDPSSCQLEKERIYVVLCQCLLSKY